MNSWVILRTSGAKTLPLARSLGEAGFEVWTPNYTEPANEARRRPERSVPILPTFLFARADRISDLAAILALPINPHPAFSFFRYTGRIPLIADSQIEGLRLVEEHSRIKSRRSKRRALVMGQRVNFDRGAFAGMKGEVVKLKNGGKSALVAFHGGFQIEIEAWQMPEDVVCNDTSRLGNVA